MFGAGKFACVLSPMQLPFTAWLCEPHELEITLACVCYFSSEKCYRSQHHWLLLSHGQLSSKVEILKSRIIPCGSFSIYEEFVETFWLSPGELRFLAWGVSN
jgi:hypothetical protein